MTPVRGPVAELTDYLAAVAETPLPADVTERAIVHLLDTVAAIASGAVLPAGLAGRSWLRQTFGDATGPATVVGTGERAPVFAAAVVNGMAAHAAETDDSHGATLSHPGCAALPAALAVAEQSGCPGATVLRAFAAGYDVGCRVGRAAHSADRGRIVGRWSSHAVIGTFAAAAAAAVCAGIGREQLPYLFSYAAQLASGVGTWVRDERHVEKAFVFGGMPAGHGVLASSLVAAGCDGVDEVFTGSPNWLEAMTGDPAPAELTDGLGDRFELRAATIKRYAVGSPCQAPLDALVYLLSAGAVRPAAVTEVEVVLEPRGAAVVDRRAMPNVNLQYLIAATLLDGGYRRANAHDAERLGDSSVRTLMRCVRLVPDPGLTGTKAATVTVRHADGTSACHTVESVRGTPANPMSVDEVAAKARDLLGDVMTPDAADGLCDAVLDLEAAADVRGLLEYLRERIPSAGVPR